MSTRHHVRDWIATERRELSWRAQAIVTLAPRQQPDERAMSHRARKALARARKRTQRR